VLDGARDLRRVMGAMHPLEHPVVEGLGPQGNAVDARGAPRSGGVRSDVFGVGFQRDFGGVGRRRMAEDVLNKRSDRFGGKQRRSPATEVYGFERLERSDLLQLRRDACDEIIRRDLLANGD